MLANADLGEFDEYGDEGINQSYQPADMGNENILDSSYMQMKNKGSTKGSSKGGAGSVYAPYAASASKSSANGKKKQQAPPKYV